MANSSTTGNPSGRAGQPSYTQKFKIPGTCQEKKDSPTTGFLGAHTNGGQDLNKPRGAREGHRSSSLTGTPRINTRVQPKAPCNPGVAPEHPTPQGDIRYRRAHVWVEQSVGKWEGESLHLNLHRLLPVDGVGFEQTAA